MASASPESHINLLVRYEFEQYPKKYRKPLTMCIHLESYLRHSDSRIKLTDEEVLAIQSTLPRRKIVFVLDTSDSMCQILPLLKQIMNKVIETCHGDHVGVVTFASRASVLSPLTNINSDQVKQSMRDQVNSLRTNGCTDLCAGILEGLSTLWKDVNEGSEPSSTERRFMVILTDGITNSGVMSTLDIQKHLDSCPNIHRTDVYCMALGSQVNQDLLQSIVVSRSGRLYAIPSAEYLSQSFGDCMGSIMSTLFTNVKITLYHKRPLFTEFPNRVAISDHETSFDIGTLFVNDSRDILVTLKEYDDQHNDQIPFYAKLSYTDARTSTAEWVYPNLNQSIDGIDAPQRRNPDVRQQQLRVLLSQIINDWEKGRDERALKDIEDEIRREGWQDFPLCKELLSCIVQLPTLSTMLCRATSTGLAAQRQTSMGISSTYTTVLQRAISNEYIHVGDEEERTDLYPIPPLLSMQSPDDGVPFLPLSDLLRSPPLVRQVNADP